MNYEIIRKKDLNATNWAGGSTTELFIYPNTSSYKERNFSFRISSATVEESPSTFTSLPTFTRLLMPINAPLKLVLEQKNEVNLKPLCTVEFDGGLHAVSHGICTDIGIMLSQGYLGNLSVAKNKIIKCYDGFTGIYALSDEINICVKGQAHTLLQGDFFIIQTDTVMELALDLPSKNSAVMTYITKKD